ncbi:MAG: 4,5-DOPA dioxygenase extradiol [Acidimicrobiia bacterium]
MSNPTMPAVFIGHGNPMNTLEHNRFTESWVAFAAQAPTPRAILAISAHWYINATAVTAMEHPKTIHDFYGFPPELFAVEYPAPGDRALAENVAAVVDPTWVGMDTDSWGLDHGTWSVLAHMYPSADIPVVQLSLDATKSLDEHVALGAALAPLRNDGVMIVASGNVVHNLGMVQWNSPDSGFDWALDFDAAAKVIMTEHPGDLAQLRAHPAYKLAVPTPDHFLPLAYLAGLASAAEATCDVLVEGPQMGSLTMTSYSIH